MRVSLDEGPSNRRIPAAPQRRAGAASTRERTATAATIDIGLVNNMPDAALEQTERQFIGLLNAAAGECRIRVKLFSLSEVVRAGAARERVELRYAPIDELWASRFHGLIVTGTEPRAPDLREEPYWRTLAKIIDWAEANTRSTIWSCLAAHAVVLHMDGIGRHPLADKCFGVFSCRKSANHAIMQGLPARLPIPHSRWNELRADELTAAGYSVLTRSERAGVDMFARQGNSLFVFFQGHPEYEARTLLGEYRRDVRRFLRGERETYPAVPHEYFDEVTSQRLAEFRLRALSDRCEALIETFPGCPEQSLQARWRPAAERLMANWLGQLTARATRRPTALANTAQAPQITPSSL
ncbi:MAG TPA: homoserine O-succinyltransferase [Xanthobacteraceae bacterium]|jgi:homoserine O-succinyltransferase|nr:homoserine O-succinyltransferase [Xanthobacteraceae bacterium]